MKYIKICILRDVFTLMNVKERSLFIVNIFKDESLKLARILLQKLRKSAYSLVRGAIVNLL